MIIAAVLALPAAAFADRPSRNGDPAGVMPPGMGASPQAVAAASRPGDEAMTCEQIGAEMQPYAMQMRQSMDAHHIQQDAADMQARNERAQRESQAQAAPSPAAGVIAGFVPGGGYAQAAAAQAQEARQQRLAEEQRPAQEQFNRDMNGFASDSSGQMAAIPASSGSCSWPRRSTATSALEAGPGVHRPAFRRPGGEHAPGDGARQAIGGV
jgi:hypothetical protein